MTCVVDTHALVWYMAADRRLSSTARAILEREHIVLVVATLVLAEIRHLIAKKRVDMRFDTVLAELRRDPRVIIHAFDLTCVERLDPTLNLHDGAIFSAKT